MATCKKDDVFTITITSPKGELNQYTVDAYLEEFSTDLGYDSVRHNIVVTKDGKQIGCYENEPKEHQVYVTLRVDAIGADEAMELVSEALSSIKGNINSFDIDSAELA